LSVPTTVRKKGAADVTRPRPDASTRVPYPTKRSQQVRGSSSRKKTCRIDRSLRGGEPRSIGALLVMSSRGTAVQAEHEATGPASNTGGRPSEASQASRSACSTPSVRSTATDAIPA